MIRLASISLGLALTALSAQAFAQTEPAFVADAIKADNSEILMGRLAISKGGDAAVRSFGQVLVQDHSANRAQAAALATQLGLAPPDAPTPMAQEQMARLERLSPRAFDREFVRMMAEDHEATIAQFKKEASTGPGPAQQLAAQSLPTLEKHLQIARSLEASERGTSRLQRSNRRE